LIFFFISVVQYVKNSNLRAPAYHRQWDLRTAYLFFKYWWLMLLHWFLFHIQYWLCYSVEPYSSTYNNLLGVLLGGCRLDMDLKLVFALEQN
jgi:hypothetical protein